MGRDWLFILYIDKCLATTEVVCKFIWGPKIAKDFERLKLTKLKIFSEFQTTPTMYYKRKGSFEDVKMHSILVYKHIFKCFFFAVWPNDTVILRRTPEPCSSVEQTHPRM